MSHYRSPRSTAAVATLGPPCCARGPSTLLRPHYNVRARIAGFAPLEAKKAA